MTDISGHDCEWREELGKLLEVHQTWVAMYGDLMQMYIEERQGEKPE